MTTKQIRIWKLGDHKQGIIPQQDAVDKLLSILEKVKFPEGSIDIVWDSMLSLQVVNLEKQDTPTDAGEFIIMSKEEFEKLTNGAE